MKKNLEKIYAVWTFENGKFVSMHWDKGEGTSLKKSVSAPSLAAVQKVGDHESLERPQKRRLFLTDH